MNIEKLLRSLRQAKKLRKILPFHERIIYGIDVSKSEYLIVQTFIKALFKSLKRAGFDICINHWGEIILTEPVNEIKVLIAVRDSLDESILKTVIKNLESKHYLSIPENLVISPSMVCQFKLSRRGTKWHSYKLNAESMKSETLAEYIVEQIQLRASMVNPQVKYDYCESLEVVTIEDILALIRYGAAAFGNSSSLYSLSKERNMFFPEKIVIENSTIQIMCSHRATHVYHLKPRELKLFQLLIPIGLDRKIEFER